MLLSTRESLEHPSSVVRSMHADRLELLAPGVCDRGLAAVGQQDGRAVGRMQGVKQRSRRELGSLRKLSLHVLGADGPDVRDLAASEMRQRLRRDGMLSEGDIVVCHGTRLLSHNASSPVRVHSLSLMLIVFTIRSGSGRARSIDNSPFFKSALKTSMPSASTKQR